jgi:2-methylisocitrate lyase-like PEP mutase family enzyme
VSQRKFSLTSVSGHFTFTSQLVLEISIYKDVKMKTQREKSDAFVTLHQTNECFVIPNPWDRGSAVLLESMGFKALASTGAGYAFTKAKPDLATDAREMLDYFREICSVTNVPISADMQQGFGDSPKEAAQTIIEAAQTGLVGGSLEDARGNTLADIYDIGLAKERIAAAAEAAKSLDFKFMLTARAENYLYGNPNIHDTIKRLQAYQEAGADVLYAPGIQSIDDIKAILSSIDKPMNLLMGFASSTLTVAEVAALGVRRISVGGAFARAAFGALKRAGEELLTQGTFNFSKEAMPGKDLNALFANRSR